MFGTLISVAFAVFLFLYPHYRESPINWETISIAILLLSLVLFFTQAMNFSSFLGPLQKAEKNFTSHLVQIFYKDRHLRIAYLFLALLPLITFLIALAGHLFSEINKIDLLAISIILFGIAIDLIYHAYKRTLTYLNPYSVIKLFTQAARKSVQDEREGDLCDWIDALSESAIKAVQHSNISLCNDALNELQVIARNFLESSKSISHHDTDKQSKEMGIGDKVSFTLFYLFQRIEMINEKAIEHNLEPASSAVITTLGKITEHAAKYDISLASYPIYILGKCAKRAQEMRFPEVANKANLTLMEVAKTIPEEVDVTYLELRDTYLTLITQLHEIAQESFKKDKTISISLLTEPFKELRKLFEGEKLAKHQDTPVILDALSRVQGEFDALELIMKTIPPIPTIPEEEKPLEPPPGESKI